MKPTDKRACVWVVEFVYWLTDEAYEWRPIYTDAFHLTRAYARARAYNAKSEYDNLRISKYVRAR